MSPYQVLVQEAFYRHAMAHGNHPSSLCISKDVLEWLAGMKIVLQCDLWVNDKLRPMTIISHESQISRV